MMTGGEDQIRYCIGVKSDEANSERIIIAHKEDSINEIRRQALSLTGVKLPEAINYGLFCPPINGKQGKFLQDERPVLDYADLFHTILPQDLAKSDPEFMLRLERQVIWLKLLPKCRSYAEPLPEAKMKKINSKTNQKLLIEAIRNRDTDKITRLLDKGLDPNYQSRDSGETPLTIAAQMVDPRTMIIELIQGGAHLDYRSKDTLTPLHKAAIAGNFDAIQTLLDLGQNPNCRDWRGLTPLYHGVAVDSPAKCSQCLLFDHAIIGVQDDMGLQEIHQACRFGRTQHLENLIHYGADLNARTKKGNTPMHICVVADQEECLRLLLFRGADSALTNASGQTPYQCALLTGRNKIANIIDSFDIHSIIPIREPPVYNESRRPIVNGPRGAVNTNSTLTSSTSRLYASPVSTIRSNSDDSTLHKRPALFMEQQQHSQNKLNGHYQNGFSEKLIDNAANNKVNGAGGERIITIKRRSQPQKTSHTGSYVDSLPEPGPSSIISDDSTSMSETGKIVYAGRTYHGKMKGAMLQAGVNGYGFVLRGARIVPASEQHKFPTQYLTNIHPASPAYAAGLRSGDYLLQINGVDVSESTHDETVNIIKSSGSKMLDLLVLTAPTGERSLHDSLMSSRNSSPAPERKAIASPTSRVIIVRENQLKPVENNFSSMKITTNGNHPPTETVEPSECDCEPRTLRNASDLLKLNYAAMPYKRSFHEDSSSLLSCSPSLVTSTSNMTEDNNNNNNNKYVLPARHSSDEDKKDEKNVLSMSISGKFLGAASTHQNTITSKMLPFESVEDLVKQRQLLRPVICLDESRVYSVSSLSINE